MSTFLQICQKVRQECGVAGEGPSSVVSQVGVLKKIVDRTARAWVDIQTSRPYWKFLRNQFTFQTEVGKREYSVVDDLGLATCDKFDRENTYLYEVSNDDEKALKWLSYNAFRSRYRKYLDARPTVVTEAPGRTLAFDSVPDKIYTVTFDYWMTPELLANNVDIPGMPDHFHDAIVWKSVMMFAGSEGATELYGYAKSMYTPIYLQLINDQGDMPTRVLDRPIAQGARTIYTRGFT